MNTIDKIRAEIERLENYYTSVEWYAEALLAFIDSLSEEPVSENLEEAAKKYRFFDFGTPDEIAQTAFKAGAKWQKQKSAENGKELLYICDKSYKVGYRDGKRDAEQKSAGWVLPEDFEEAVYKVANFISPFDNEEELRKTSHRFAEQLLSLAREQMPLPEDTLIFRKGVEEGKRLMMEEAIVYVAQPDVQAGNIQVPFIRIGRTALFRYGIRVGNKVRIIIVKEDKK